MGKGFDLQSYIDNAPVDRSAEIARAYEVHSSIISGAQTAQQGLYQMAQGFKAMRDEKLYKAMGYDTFADYCEKETGITRQAVYRYIAIAEKLPENFVTQCVTNGIGMRNLAMLTTLTDEERQNIVETTDIETATVKELREKIKELTDSKVKAEQEAIKLHERPIEETEEYIALKNANTALEMLRKNQSDKLDELKVALEQTRQEKDKLEDEIHDMETRLMDVPAEIDVTESDEYRQLVEEMDSKEKLAAQLESKNANLTKKIDTLTAQIKELENRPVEIAVQEVPDDSEIERLTAELEKAKNDIAEAKERLKRAEDSSVYKDFIIKMSVEEYKEFLMALENEPNIGKGKVNFLSIMKTARIIG